MTYGRAGSSPAFGTNTDADMLNDYGRLVLAANFPFSIQGILGHFFHLHHPFWGFWPSAFLAISHVLSRDNEQREIFTNDKEWLSKPGVQRVHPYIIG